MSAPVIVIDVVGLTPRLLAHMPRTRAVAERGFQAELGTVLPAVTCSAQTTLLTGVRPEQHGIVGNGWFFRDLGEVLLWRQHDRLVEAERVWDTARRVRPELKAANAFWWYAMGASTDITLTPRPVYHADGRKDPDFYARPPSLHDRLEQRLGTFPLFRFWGPGADIASTRWITDAALDVLRDDRPDLLLVYLPHLDYDLQRFSPHGPQAQAAAAEVDVEVGRLVDAAAEAAAHVVILSEYGLTPVSRPVDVNRALRAAGLLEVHAQAGMEYLDPWASRAFAVADHQVAHVYVRHAADLARVRDVVAGLPGVDEVLDDAGKRAAGLNHPRAGELVAVAEPDAWFTYYYWLDDARAPDFARTVEIHRKPGYDPAELTPLDSVAVKARAATALGRKALGLRYTLDVVPLDPAAVAGSHGRLPDDPLDGPVLLCTAADLGRARFSATEVRDLLLRLLEAAPAT